MAKYVPETFHHRLIISEASKERGWFNQYYLDHGLYDAYQPILYCDVDVVFDASITDLLIDVLRSGRICCATEAHALSHLAESQPRQWEDWTANFFGRDFYTSDPEFQDVKVALGNAGVVGFENTARTTPVNDLFRMIASRQGSEQLRIYTDQPILNYVLHKTRFGDFQVLDRYCRLTRSLEATHRRRVAASHIFI